MRPRAIFLGEEFQRVMRADQQGGEPIRRRRILWETAQAWNGGVAEWSRVWDFGETRPEKWALKVILRLATPSFRQYPSEGVREGVNRSEVGFVNWGRRGQKS